MPSPMLLAAGAPPSAGLALAALGVALAGLALTTVLAVRTRPRRPTTTTALSQELRDEPPAVVHLLVGGCEVHGAAAVATLVDLAARRHVDIDDVGGHHVLVRSRRHGGQLDGHAAPDATLTRYEQRLLDHLEASAGADGAVPAEALSTGPAAASTRWHEAFAAEVVDDARSRGLCRRRWGVAQLAPVWASVAVGLVLVALSGTFADAARGAADSTSSLLWGMAVLSITVLGVVAASLTASGAQRPTAEGRAVAHHWSGLRAWYRTSEMPSAPAASVAIWDRHLAYATALGAAPSVERQLPLDAEHDRRAWSRHGGVVRPVHVRYWSPRPGWGQPPWAAAIAGALQAAFAGSLAYGATRVAQHELDALGAIDPQSRRWIVLTVVVMAGVLVAATLWATAKCALAVVDLFARRDVEGLVVRSRTSPAHDPQRPSRHHVALDDGTTDRITAYRVRRGRTAPQGAVARLRVTPRLGYVTRVEVIAATSSPGAAAPPCGSPRPTRRRTPQLR